MHEVNKPNQEESVIVFDVGGGTTDLTLLEIRRHESMLEFKVRVSTGRRVGGEDVTSKVAKEIMDMVETELLADKDFIKNKCVLPRDNRAFIFDVYKEAELAKVALASKRKTKYQVRLGFDCIGEDGEEHVFTKRVHVTAQQVQKAFGVLLKAIKDSYDELQKFISGQELTAKNKLLLVGGSGMAVCVSTFVNEIADGASLKTTVGMSRCIADGAALFQEWTRTKKSIDFSLTDTVSKQLGIVCQDTLTGQNFYKPMLEPHTALPTGWKGHTFTTPAESDSMGITVCAAVGERRGGEANCGRGKMGGETAWAEY